MNTRLFTSPYIGTLSIFCLLLLSVFSCNSDDEMTIDPMDPGTMMQDSMDMSGSDDTFEITSLMGSSQKGPYLIGSTINIFELEEDLSPTGRSFAEDISDNLGSFEISNLSLVSSFVELRAEGFYYNEVTGENSAAQLNLTALVDLDNKEAININILTTLEQKRVEYLIANGSSFVEAKSQAVNEVLRVFEIENANIPESDLLNIAQSGEGNAILLAISAMIQGNNSVGVVSEIISKISNDLEEDGVLDDVSVCTQLSSSASLIDPQTIRQNLESYYSTGGANVTIPAFENFLIQFVQNTPCLAESNISYPADGFNGLNLLAVENTVFQVGENYSMRAILEEGTSLEVRVVGNNWVFEIGQGASGWIVGEWDGDFSDIDRGRLFTANGTGSVDFKINLREPFIRGLFDNQITFEIFENGSATPTRTKTITIEGITPRPQGNTSLVIASGSNLLAELYKFGFNTVANLHMFSNFGFAVYLPENFEVELIVQGENFEFAPGDINQGWEIELTDPSINQWRLTASGRGYYEAEVRLLEGQGCTTMNVETFLNGNGHSSFDLSSDDGTGISMGVNTPSNGDHGLNILASENTITAGDVSLRALLGIPYGEDVTAVLTGQGWSIPTPIENEKWIIEDFDPASQSQTFIGTVDYNDYDNSNDLKLSIDAFNAGSPPQIRVDIFENTGSSCGLELIESFDVKF